jgi:type I restriction enzyme S subunit
MRRYDSYKDSVVEWIGLIPCNWTETRLRFIGNLFGGLTGKSGDDFKQDDNPNNKPYIPYTNIFRNTYISKEHVDFVVIEDGENQNRVKKYDLFFLMSSETYQDLGKPCILIEDVEELYLNSFCKGFRVNKMDVNPLFLNYQLLGDVHKELISIEGRGFTRINLRQDRLNDTPILLPPLSEQSQIVSYLDNKTSQIESLIEKTQRKIELLTEKRTSFINEVVTKGLNPNLEMKDSGVEWIGEIPSHWDVKRLKYLIEDDGGIKIGPFGSSLKLDTLTEEGIKVYGQGNVIKDDFTIGHRHIPIERFDSDFSQYEILEGDVLITMMGTTGKSKVFKKEFKRGILDSHLLRLRFKSESFISDLFVTILQESDYVFHQLRLNSKGSIMEGLNSSIVKELILLTPPLTEQQQIVSYLDEHTQLIDKTISVEQRRIDLLKDYRQTIISEVVTGKRKVTNDD